MTDSEDFVVLKGGGLRDNWGTDTNPGEPSTLWVGGACSDEPTNNRQIWVPFGQKPNRNAWLT
jgi:hypothetical protein